MRIKYIPTNDSRGQLINRFILNNYPQFLKETKPDLIFVTGGDGALLHAIQDNLDLQAPFFGHATGTLNFMMNEIGNLDVFFMKLLKKQYKLHYLQTTAIKVSIKKKEKMGYIGQAMNEVVLGTSIMGYHHLLITSKDKSFSNFEIKGSGISIATDFGTTGYNFNLGGPILPLGKGLWAVVGIVCNRYLNDILKVQKMEIKSISERGPVDVYLDGVRQKRKFLKGESLILEKGDVVHLAFINKNTFFKKRLELASRYRK